MFEQNFIVKLLWERQILIEALVETLQDADLLARVVRANLRQREVIDEEDLIERG